MNRFFKIIIFIIFVFYFPALTFPKYEVRAVWLTTVGGADWPKSKNKVEQQQSLIEIFEILQKKKINTIFFQVRSRGNTFYKSDYEPWAAELTGTLGKDPNWDPLQFALEEAHKRGIELHAWFNVNKVYSQKDTPSSSQHIVVARPHWVQLYEGEWWLDIGKPEVRAYLVNLVRELVQKYDIDGIHFDFIRYPGPTFHDDNTFQQYGNGIEKDEWRRNNITNFVRDVYETILIEKPLLKVGSAPIGIYHPIAGAQSSFNGYCGVYQDSRRWLREGIHDYITPQVYWSLGEEAPADPDFAALSSDWSNNGFGRHVYIGLGVYKENVRNEITQEIAYVRNIPAFGVSFFRYENFLTLSSIDVVYPFPSLIPPMPWKDCIPPLPPTNIQVTQVQSNQYNITWSKPKPAVDGDEAANFVIYRSNKEVIDISDPASIVAVVPSTQTTYTDSVSNNEKYYYTITALDRGNNESYYDKMPQLYTQFPLLSLLTSFSQQPLLSQNYPNPFFNRTYISYELPKKSLVELYLKDKRTQKRIFIVNEVQNAGTHIISIDGRELLQGEYEYELKTDSQRITKIMYKK